MQSFEPLHGIQVLDLTKVLAGPLCTQYLSDLGAEVIKIEPCDEGDDTRGWPPLKGTDGAVFMSANRNKQSLAVDLKTDAGRDIVLRLAARADVVVESYRKGAVDRLGLGHETLMRRNPRLIYASISGFGRTGPLSPLPGYDLMMQSFSGIMALTGEKGGGPVRSAFSPLDQCTGIWAALGILAALRHRDATGEGKYLEVSLFESAIALQAPTAHALWNSGRLPERCGSGHESLCPYQAFQASDTHILVAVGNDSLWRKFCEVSGLQQFADDPRYRTNALRVERFDETVALVAAQIRTRTAAEWEKILTDAGVPNSRINELDDVLEMEQTRERGIVMDYEHPTYGACKSVAMPVTFGDAPREVKSAPPLVGQHTEAVLSGLGYPGAEIAALRAKGVVRQSGKA